MNDPHPSILHLYNTAGIASTLAKWTNKVYGANTDVYAMTKCDPFEQTIYGTPRLETGGRFFSFIFQNIQEFDIVHIHGFDYLIHMIRKRHPKKPIVIHYHGTDIRYCWNRQQRYWGRADAVLASTRDLLSGAPKRCQLLPPPVDTDLFCPTSQSVAINPDSALSFKYRADKLAIKIAEEHGLNLYLSPRNISFAKMPQFLQRFSWYIDVKRDREGRLYRHESLTGLEALACGLKVIGSDEKIKEGLPPQHKAENAVKTLRPIYMRLSHGC